MANVLGVSATPVVIFGPDPAPVRAPGSIGGVSAPPGYQGPPPAIDPAVAAIARVYADKHGGK